MITTTLPTYTYPAPSRSQNEDDFNDNVQYAFTYFSTFYASFNTAVSEINATALSVSGWATNALSYKNEAQAFAALAATSAGAEAYDNSATYNNPNTVVGSDGQVYRCLGTGVTGDNPVGSSTGNWSKPLGFVEGFNTYSEISCTGLSAVSLDCTSYDTFIIYNIDTAIELQLSNLTAGRTVTINFADEPQAAVTFDQTVQLPGGKDLSFTANKDILVLTNYGVIGGICAGFTPDVQAVS